ncbi:MAG TPA: DUF5693 family protein [Petrotogaceae bacterium]|nr:DUF5693 family protein [Petrotogaceae bacterium]HQF32423.1 DUF5693 family protein [Petrotogaceae bacterium]HQI78353.1 DUF5693 family protein [Petrotogaceae bacterium]
MKFEFLAGMRKYLFISLFIFVIVFSVIASIYDVKSMEEYFFFPEEELLEKTVYTGITFYVYNNSVVLKELDEKIMKEASIMQFLSYLNGSYNRIFITEFSDFEKYFTQIKDKIPSSIKNKIFYVHYIKNAEIDKFDDNTIVQRFIRAHRERRISYFLMPVNPRTQSIKLAIKNEIGSKESFEIIRYKPYFLIAWIGFGFVFSIFMTYNSIIAFVYAFTYIFFNSWSFTVAASVFSVIIFFKISSKNVFKIIFFGLLLGITVYSSAYTYEYIYKLTNVRGVKILLLSLLILVFIKYFKTVSFKQLELKKIVPLFLALSAGIVFYIMRSGNWAFVSNFERKARDMLEKILIARPRSKELLSYIFFYTKPFEGMEILWRMMRAVLVISILDTFLHVHSPVYLGVLRTINGFAASFIILALIELIKKIKTPGRR